MVRRHVRSTLLTGLALAAGFGAVAGAKAQAPRPLTIDTARITIAGTSNIHAYTASTTVVRVTRASLSGAAGPTLWEGVTRPGAIAAFEVAIPAAQLTSPKEGLDKNMHKALKAQEHPDITFRLTSLEAGAAAGTLKAQGVLRIAGVEQNVVLDLTTERREATFTVKGKLDLLMTDYGIKPPTAMLGMLKTDPKVTVTFETVLAVPLT
jgi:polyisoprenoid-binding protein YceI